MALPNGPHKHHVRKILILTKKMRDRKTVRFFLFQFMFTAGMMLFIQFVLMIVTVCRVPTLQYNGTPLPSSLTSRDRRARRNFMRLSVTLTTYSLISWLPELMLSFVLRSGDSTVQAQQGVLITSDLFMCVLYISPSILPLLISCTLITTHHRFDFGFSPIGHVREVTRLLKRDDSSSL